MMTEDQVREMVKGCGLDWQRGYMPLFDGDPTNRYAVLVNAARTNALQTAARWVDEEVGRAAQEGWGVEALQALMATRDMLRAHADMQETTVEARPSTDTPRWRAGAEAR
jgi:hypothetical protein